MVISIPDAFISTDSGLDGGWLSGALLMSSTSGGPGIFFVGAA